ncbi:unnamed protein product, partial [Rotaria socialis]
RPLTEHSEFNRNNNRLKILSDENEMFNNRQQVPIMG